MSEKMRKAPECERCGVAMKAEWMERQVVGWYCPVCNAEGTFEQQIGEIIDDLENGDGEEKQPFNELSNIFGETSTKKGKPE